MKNDLDQINKLAREYAENKYKLFSVPQNETWKEADEREFKQVLEWLCKDHLIVEKSKVESAWLNSISDSLSDDYTTSQQGYTANKVIEELFQID